MIEQIEQLRQAGWLVVLKAMPEQGEFLAGNDWTRDPKLKAKYVCEACRLPWANDYPEHPSGQRAFWAYGDDAEEAVMALLERHPHLLNA